jgi:hypothetical protein
MGSFSVERHCFAKPWLTEEIDWRGLFLSLMTHCSTVSAQRFAHP